MKLTFIISIVLIAIITGVIIKYTSMNNGSDKINTEQEVLKIAQQELFKHYPEGVRGADTYILINATPFVDSSNWMVVYDIPNSLDTRVEIVVDPILKKVVSYKDLWS